MSERLDAALGSRDSVFDLPVPGPETTAKLRAWIACQDGPALPTEDETENVVMALALVLPRRKEDQGAAAAKMETYTRALADIPACDLNAARDWLILNTQWFPTIYEIRKAAGKFTGPRQAKVARARILIRRHEEEWTAPVPTLSVEEFAALKAEIGIKLDDTGEGRQRDAHHHPGEPQ